MIFLILAILCSSSIALILKQGHVKNANVALLINANYLTASFIAFGFILFKYGFHLSIESILFGAVLGSLLAGTFFIYSKAISIAGTALATVSARLSVLIPVLLSIIIFGESPNVRMIFGFVLALITLYLFYLSLKQHSIDSTSAGKYIYLFALLLAIGLIDFSLKIFENNFLLEEKGIFVFAIFSSAFFYTLVYVLKKKIKFEKNSIKLGLLLGIPNVLAIHFLLGALNELPAIVVFPVMNIGVIVLTAVAAYLFWKEQINLYGKIAIGVGIAAILLLKL